MCHPCLFVTTHHDRYVLLDERHEHLHHQNHAQLICGEQIREPKKNSPATHLICSGIIILYQFSDSYNGSAGKEILDFKH